MELNLRHLKFDFNFPAKEEPAWSREVERWYQLDAFAYGLTEAFTALKDHLSQPPDFIVLGSAHASNPTDFAFASTGAASPSKFVHTLPNVRGAPLLQVMKWAGPTLCIQKDPCSQIASTLEAVGLLHADPRLERVWTLGVHRLDSAAHQVRINEVTKSSKSDLDLAGDHCLICPSELDTSLAMKIELDSEWMSWIDGDNAAPFRLSHRFEIRKKN